MKRILPLLLVIVLMILPMLSACGAGGGEEARTITPNATTQAGSPVAVSTSTPAATTPGGPAPTGDILTIQPNDPIVIGYALVTSGPNSNLGIDSRRGIELAIDDVGGKVVGHPIELVGEDTGCSAEGGQAAAQKLRVNEKIVGIIGTTCSSEAIVMAPVIDAAGMVMISPSNTAPELTAPGKHVKGYLRTAHNDKVQGKVAAEFACKVLNLRKAATIHDGSVYAEQLARVFADEFTACGGQIVAREAVGEKDTDMQPVLTSIAAKGPQLIYYPIFMPAGGHITKQARAIDGLKDVVLMGADGLFNPDFVQAAGSAAIGMYLSSPDLTSLGNEYQKFLQKHRQRYNEEPLSVYHAHAYDATMLLLRAIQQTAETSPDGTVRISRTAIRDALYSTRNYQGLTGNLTCDQYGDCADPNIVVYKIVKADPKSWKPGDPNVDPDANPQRVYPAGGKDQGAKPTPHATPPVTPTRGITPTTTQAITGTQTPTDSVTGTGTITGTEQITPTEEQSR